MPQIVYTQPLQASSSHNCTPWSIEISARLIRLFTGDDETTHAGQACKDRNSRRIEYNRLPSGFAIWKEKQTTFEVDVIQSQVENFAKASARQQKQPNSR